MRFPNQRLQQCSKRACCTGSLTTCPAASSLCGASHISCKPLQPYSHDTHAAVQSKRLNLSQAYHGAESSAAGTCCCSLTAVPTIMASFAAPRSSYNNKAKGRSEQLKARTSDDRGHLLLQPGGCARGYLSLLLSSFCLAVGLLLAPLQLREHIHNDLQQPCRQSWSASHVGPAGQVAAH